MVVFKCEACGVDLRVPDGQAGKKGKCRMALPSMVGRAGA